MRKLSEVEEAKALMTEAMDWSVFKWLFEKGRVRETADRANDALDALEKRVKARWRDEIKTAYKQSQHANKSREEVSQESASTDPEIPLFLESVKRADEKARRAHLDAEKTFDEAERLLSTELAVQGCKKAIRSWELRETAIRLAETGVASNAET